MIRAVYHAVTDEPVKLARSIAVEETVEVPEALIDERTNREIVGKVEGTERLPDGRFALRIAYPKEIVHSLPDLLSVLYGNVSLMEGVRLAELELPAELLARFKGPGYGIEGIRDLLGVKGRPLLCTVLKPRGASDEHFAQVAAEFALAGGDLVKEDNNLLDATHGAFEQRVGRCAEAVARANSKTGRNCLYFANACVAVDRLERTVEAALRLGAKGILIPPLLLGLDVVRDLAARHRLAVMAHPAFSGTFFQDRRHGVDPGILLGTFYRLAGVDISIFVNHGGRFNHPKEECLGIARALRAPLGRLRPALAAPAGGMTLDRIDEMAKEYGQDTVLVFGGALLGGSGGIGKATEAGLARVHSLYGA